MRRGEGTGRIQVHFFLAASARRPRCMPSVSGPLRDSPSIAFDCAPQASTWTAFAALSQFVPLRVDLLCVGLVRFRGTQAVAESVLAWSARGHVLFRTWPSLTAYVCVVQLSCCVRLCQSQARPPCRGPPTLVSSIVTTRSLISLPIPGITHSDVFRAALPASQFVRAGLTV